jgi:hypothetical protein
MDQLDDAGGKLLLADPSGCLYDIPAEELEKYRVG